MEALIAKRYAKALSGAVSNVEEAVAVLEEIGAAIASPKAARVIDAPIVGSAEKTALIVEALGDQVDGAIVNFIKLLGEHGRLGLLPEIVKVLRADLQRKANRYEGVVESASEVDEAKIGALEEALSNYSGTQVKLHTRQSDVDGLRVRVEDLGLEVNFSKERVKMQLIDYIKQSL